VLARSLRLRKDASGIEQNMDSVLPFMIAIGAAVACCVFLVGGYLTKPSETVAPLIPFPAAPVATALKPREDRGEKITERMSQERSAPNPAARDLSHVAEKTGQPARKMSWQRIAAYVAGAFVGIIALLIAIGWNIDDSPRAKLERIRDECDRSYGKGTSRSVDCFAELISRFAIEQQRSKMDRIYQNAR
jgi:hypothetical protein